MICPHCKKETTPIKSLKISKTFCEHCYGCIEVLHERASRQSKYLFSVDTCPKNETWFVDGGRCGWAHECAQCSDNTDLVGKRTLN